MREDASERVRTGVVARGGLDELPRLLFGELHGRRRQYESTANRSVRQDGRSEVQRTEMPRFSNISRSPSVSSSCTVVSSSDANIRNRLATSGGK